MKIYLSFSLSITDAKSLCHESSRELEKPEMPKRGREKPWLGKTNSGARLFDSGSLFRFVSNTFQPGFFFTSTFWKIFILVSCNGSVSRFVPRWRLKDNLPEAPVLPSIQRLSQSYRHFLQNSVGFEGRRPGAGTEIISFKSWKRTKRAKNPIHCEIRDVR